MQKPCLHDMCVTQHTFSSKEVCVLCQAKSCKMLSCSLPCHIEMSIFVMIAQAQSLSVSVGNIFFQLLCNLVLCIRPGCRAAERRCCQLMMLGQVLCSANIRPRMTMYLVSQETSHAQYSWFGLSSQSKLSSQSWLWS